ncbi:ral-GDS-related protein-like [Glossophaga mutica]
MVPALLGGYTRHISTFMSIHPAFSRAHRFLDQLLSRTLASVSASWPDQIRYFSQPLLYPWLILKQALVEVSFPSANLVSLIQTLRLELDHPESNEAGLEDPPPELQSTPVPLEGSVPGPDPALAELVLEPVPPPPAPPSDLEQAPTPPSAPGPAHELEPAGPPTPPPGPDNPGAVTTEPLVREEERNILTFPPRLVAEQLTGMDVELFKQVLPHQCLGSVWPPKDKSGRHHRARTVSATIRQYNSLVTCVITTCLGDRSMKARDRAKVVEHWIKVAQECKTLRNMASLHAIVSAFRSVPLHRLKNTWEKVSRRSSVMLRKLFQDVDAMTTKQLRNIEPRLEKRPSRFATLLMNLRGALQRPQKKGHVKKLEKRRKELRVLEEIVLLQEAAQLYSIEPEEQFGAWFWALERLSEKESYTLSCQLEPRA